MGPPSVDEVSVLSGEDAALSLTAAISGGVAPETRCHRSRRSAGVSGGVGASGLSEVRADDEATATGVSGGVGASAPIGPPPLTAAVGPELPLCCGASA